jgi:hypothetical protein
MKHNGSDPTGLLWSPLAPGCPELESGDGGVHTILDCTTTPDFRESNLGLDAIEAYSVAGTAFADHTNLYLGTQDNAMFVSTDTGATWRGQAGGDVFQVLADPNGPGSNVLYFNGGFNVGNVDVSTSTAWATPPKGGIGAITQFGSGAYAVITSDNATPPTWSLQVTTNNGGVWTTVGPKLPAGPCFAIGGCDRWVSPVQVAAPPGGNPVFFLHLGKAPGSSLYRVSGPLNATATLTDLGAPPAAGKPRALQEVFSFGVDPADPTRAYVFDNTGTGKMMRGTAASVNGAFTWTEDTTLEKLLTIGGTSTIVNQIMSYGFDPASRTVVIGTHRAGVLLSLDGGLNWYTARGSTAIPKVVSIYINPNTHKVYAASFGRGLWEIRPASRLDFAIGGGLPLFPGGLRTITGTTRISLLGVTSGSVSITGVSYRFYRPGTTPPAFTTVKGTGATFSIPGSNGVYFVDAFATDNAGNERMRQSEQVDLENPGTVCSASTTLHGTFILDAEKCAQTGNLTGDLFWEQIDTVQRQLVPFSAGDQIAVLGKVDFSKVTLDQIRSASLTTTPVNGSNNTQNKLTPGTVLALHTRAGHYAKIRVDSYGYDLGLTMTTYKQTVHTPPPVVLCTNAGTLQGTFILDAEKCAQSGNLTGDLFWEQIDTVQRQLVPFSAGDQVAVLGKVDFGTVSLADLKSAPYGTNPVNGSNNTQNRLTPGTVLAIHTRNGHFAKMRIDSYGYNLGIAVVTYQ